MTHVDVFDPPMCCSTGVCGPSVDPLLAAFAADVEWLTAQGVTVVRHNLSQDPQPFVSNTRVLDLATPIHEAMQLERDLARADITPLAWVVNQSLTPLEVTDPVLRARRSHEAVHLGELAAHGRRVALEPWHADVLAADAVGA